MENEPPSSKYVKALERIRNEINNNLDNLERAYSADGRVLDYSHESIELLARRNLPDRRRQFGFRASKTIEYIGEGGVLGEVIIRNLGGEWVYPSYARMRAYLILRDIGIPISLSGRILFPKIQVRLKGELIPVMKIAKLRIGWDERVFSLPKAYEEIRRTGKWSGKVSATPPEKRILNEKKRIWRIRKWSWLYDPLNHNTRGINGWILRIMLLRESMRKSEATGGDDYSLDGLKAMDEFFSRKSLMERIEAEQATGIQIGDPIYRDDSGRKAVRNRAIREVGGYLGELIVRNLGGEWIFPTRQDYHEMVVKHQNYEYLQERTLVKLHNTMIPVMEIARRRLDEEIPSLADVYERIRTTGKWE